MLLPESKRRKTIGVKEIDGGVAGWPDTHASLVFKDQLSTRDSTQVSRLLAAGK